MGWTTAITIALMGISTGIQVYSTQQQKKAAEGADAYNRKLAESEAQRKEMEAHENMRRSREEKRRRMAMAKSRLSAAGVAMGEGTGADVLEVLDMRLETEIQDASRMAELETRAIRAGAEMDTWKTRQNSAALDLQTYGTLLSGASQAAGSFSNTSYKSR